MDIVESSTLFTNSDISEEGKTSSKLLDCCKETIDMHAAYNAMMVCSGCKQIIKCFDSEKPFINYQRFCASRHRRILATKYRDHFIIIFSSYETYST
jgi:hypothetical protein